MMESDSREQASSHEMRYPDLTHEVELIFLELGIDSRHLERAKPVIVEILQQIYDNYGREDSDTYLPRHNDRHALAVMQRSLKLWTLLSSVLPERFDSTDDIGLLAIAAVGHDIIWRKGEEMGVVEAESGIETARIMQKYGYSEEEVLRVVDAIMATVVSMDNDNRIIQLYLRTGSKDILRYILAVADINGIAMEGKESMYNEAFALYQEDTTTTIKSVLFNPGKLINLLKYQHKFLMDRYKERDDDIEYFFGEDAGTVKDLFDEVFSSTFQEALREANVLDRRGIARRAIMTTLGGTADGVVQTTTLLNSMKKSLIDTVKNSRFTS